MRTEVMVAYAYDTIARRNPLGFFGMVHVLEGTSVSLALLAADRIQQSLGLPDSAFSYLRSHGTLDQEHTAHFAEPDGPDHDRGDQADIVHAARALLPSCMGMCSAACRCRRRDAARTGAGQHESPRRTRAAHRRHRRHRPAAGRPAPRPGAALMLVGRSPAQLSALARSAARSTTPAAEWTWHAGDLTARWRPSSSLAKRPRPGAATCWSIARACRRSVASIDSPTP